MFDIQWVKLENFRSFRGAHTFKLPVTPGLYLITGENEVEPRLTSNGTGKSTLFEAIYWCLYGKTTRGLKAGDVIHWDERTCNVTVAITVGSEQLQIRRVQSPNSLSLTRLGAKTLVTQATLEKHLRLGPEAFTYAVLLPQFGQSFFDRGPAEKLTLFSEILVLEFWLEKAKLAESLTDELITTRTKIEQEKTRLDSEFAAHQGDLKALISRNKSFSSYQNSVVKSYKQQLVKLEKNEVKINEDMYFAEAALDNIKRKQEGTKICPTCKQPLPHKDAEALERNKADWQRKFLQLSQQQASCRVEHKSFERQLLMEQNRPNPYTEIITQKQGKIKAAKERLVAIEQELFCLERDISAVGYWTTGFKRIRLFIIEETLRKLEIEVNNSISSLGLLNWRIEFDVERENKSGGITKGFVVFVYPPDRKEPIRFESYSGGETQRLRLAGDLGLANLIMEQAGLTSMFEVFDEPASYLSEEGLVDVAETLHQRALEHGKRIFLIDHTAIDFGDFAGHLLITKTEEGSRLAPL